MLRKLGQNIKLQSVFILLREWKAIWALKAATARPDTERWMNFECCGRLEVKSEPKLV